MCVEGFFVCDTLLRCLGACARWFEEEAFGEEESEEGSGGGGTDEGAGASFKPSSAAAEEEGSGGGGTDEGAGASFKPSSAAADEVTTLSAAAGEGTTLSAAADEVTTLSAAAAEVTTLSAAADEVTTLSAAADEVTTFAVGRGGAGGRCEEWDALEEKTAEAWPMSTLRKLGFRPTGGAGMGGGMGGGAPTSLDMAALTDPCLGGAGGGGGQRAPFAFALALALALSRGEEGPEADAEETEDAVCGDGKVCMEEEGELSVSKDFPLTCDKLWMRSITVAAAEEEEGGSLSSEDKGVGELDCFWRWSRASNAEREELTGAGN